MANALEVRSPLLDHRVYEFAARLPSAHKLRHGTLKRSLKELARRRGMPAHLVDRPKTGFGVPIDDWFRGPLRSWIEDLPLDDRTLDRGLLHAHEIARLLRDHVDRRVDHAPRLWNLAMLELWHRTWIDDPASG